MSSEERPRVRNRRRVGFKNSRWLSYVGDFSILDAYLGSKSGIKWLFPKFLNAYFRGLSQVLFANNPLSGLLLLIALFWVDLIVGLATILGGVLSILVAVLMKQDPGAIQAGLTTYNGILVGCVTASLWTPIYNEPLSIKIWAFIVVGSIISVFVNSACGNIMSSFKIPLPCLTLPFNIIILLLFTVLMPPIVIVPQNVSDSSVMNMNMNTNANLSDPSLPEAISALNESLKNGLNNYSSSSSETNDTRQIIDEIELDPISNDTRPLVRIETDETTPETSINWGKVLIGTIMSMGQIFAVENLFASILMYIAVLLYSPLLCFMSFIGGIIGTFAGLLFTSGATYSTVYAGIWGYNSILSASSVGGFFFAINCHSFWTAIANVLLTVVLQQGFVIAFRDLRLPFFTLPFVLSTFMFLSVTSFGDQLYRVKNISYPEMHRFDYVEMLRNKKTNRNMQEQAPENKEFIT